MPRSFDSVFYGAAGGGVDLPSDDQFNRVSFLSHFDGANNGVNNAFDDGSSSNHTITARFNSTQGSFGPFARPDGEWAVSLNTNTSVTETGYLRVPSSGDFGTGNFTYEAWVYFVEGGGSPVLLENSGGAVAVFRFGNTTSYLFGSNSATGQTSVSFSDLSASTFQWHHVALVRSSGVIKCYLNGTASSTTLSSSQTTGAAEYIGTARNYTSGTRLFDGYISNVRFSDIARYTSNFTPSTAPFVSDSNTDLLTCQSNRFVDNSSNGRTVTPYGQSAVTAFGPFLTSSVYDPAVNGASGYFDGTDDLTIPTSSDFNLSNNPFTFSFWANFSDGGTVYGRYYYPTGKRETFISTEDTGAIRIRVSETGGGYSDHATASGVFVFNQWNYIVITRTISGSDSVFKTYVNGTLSKTTTIGFTTINYDNQVTYIMNYGYVDDRPTGYLCDFKLVNGTATAPNSSNPTAPATNTTNTKLLLNMADGQAIDSAAQNNLNLYGTAKTSTAQKLFGTASLLLDGNSDLATISSEAGNFGTGNFTIEFSFRLAANVGGTPNSCIAKWETSGSQRSWMVRIDNVSSANKIKFFDSADGSANSSTTFSTSFSSETWYKIAVVNVSGTVSLYVNGTADSTTHSLASGAPYASTGLVSIGANVPSSPDNFFNGNIDEVRLSKFARYTSNFTAPTEPFADKGQDA